jgi:hypothetical protein
MALADRDGSPRSCTARDTKDCGRAIELTKSRDGLPYFTYHYAPLTGFAGPSPSHPPTTIPKMRPGKHSRGKRQTTGTRFEFITVSGNNVAGDDTTRRRVRSHAMVDYKRRSTQPKESQNHTIELDVTPLLDGSLQPTAAGLHAVDPEQSLVSRGPSPASLLDTYRSDPFGTFPINGTHRSRQLWDHSELLKSRNTFSQFLSATDSASV